MRYLGARRKLRAAEMPRLPEPVFFGPFRVAPGGPGIGGCHRDRAVSASHSAGGGSAPRRGAADREDVIDSRKVIARLMLAGACGGGGARCRVGGYGSVCGVVVIG